MSFTRLPITDSATKHKCDFCGKMALGEMYRADSSKNKNRDGLTVSVLILSVFCEVCRIIRFAGYCVCPYRRLLRLGQRFAFRSGEVFKQLVL